MKLNRSCIESFVGDVVSLYDTDGSSGLFYSLECECAVIKVYNKGALIALSKKGEGKITVSDGKDSLTVPIKVREMVSSVGDELNYYFADFHNHTTMEHNYDRFIVRKEDHPTDFLRIVKEDGGLDAVAITDHAECLNGDCFFEGYLAAEQSDGGAVAFAGAESEVELEETDRFGIRRRISGEIVTFSSMSYAQAKNYEDFKENFKSDPAPVGIFAHPQVMGFSTPCVWNFSFDRINDPEMRRIMKGIECINRGCIVENYINEYSFVKALDSGFRISSVASSDSHGPKWGYHIMTPKTVVMAKCKSREAFLDAMINNRFYATESGDLRLKLTVNGRVAPCELKCADSYSFELFIDTFSGSSENMPFSYSLISDGGIALDSGCCEGLDKITVTVSKKNASFFFFRLVDKNGKRTWSVPVFVDGKKIESEMTDTVLNINVDAMHIESGKTVPALTNGDPFDPCIIECAKASFLIDLGQKRRVGAIGHLPMWVERGDTVQLTNERLYSAIIAAPSEIEILGSIDGNDFSSLGKFRVCVFGGEELFKFTPSDLRYLIFKVHSNVGCASGNEKAKNDRIIIGNLSVFGS